jgi:molybdopterin synthase catalytic subunit
MIQIVIDPIDPQRSYELLQPGSAGSILLHFAIVKADGGSGQSSSAVEYHAEAGAEAELEEIASILRAGWPISDVLLQRRSGVLAVGEIISLVAVCAEASVNSFAACQVGLELLKKMKTIRKREVFI